MKDIFLVRYLKEKDTVEHDLLFKAYKKDVLLVSVLDSNYYKIEEKGEYFGCYIPIEHCIPLLQFPKGLFEW